MVAMLTIGPWTGEADSMEALMSNFPSRGVANTAAVLALASGLAFAPMAPARADVVFDFGTLPANNATCTSKDCVLSSAVQTFTTGGITVGADSYAETSSTASTASSSGTDVSQRFGASGANETGLGVYTQRVDSTTGSTLEISSSEFLLLDNSAAIAAHYTLSSLSLSSIQGGEGGVIDVYSASTIGSTLTISQLTNITTLSNPATGTQEVQTYQFVPTNDTNYIVVTASAGNVLVQQEDFNLSSNNNGGSSVPEPSSLLLYGTFALALGFATWRRRAI